MIEIIGHRGAPLDAPENSRAAIDAAFDQGADRVEIDVQLSADGVPFVSHDASTERCTDRALQIGRTPAGALLEARLGNGESLPTLREICERVAPRGKIDLEIKSVGVRTVEACHTVLSETGLLDDALITSFETSSLRAMRRLGYRGKLGLLIGSKSLKPGQRALETWPLPAMRRCGADALVIHHALLHRPLRAALRSRNLGVYLWLSMEDDMVAAARRNHFYERAARHAPDGVICGRVRETKRAIGAL